MDSDMNAYADLSHHRDSREQRRKLERSDVLNKALDAIATIVDCVALVEEEDTNMNMNMNMNECNNSPSNNHPMPFQSSSSSTMDFQQHLHQLEHQQQLNHEKHQLVDQLQKRQQELVQMMSTNTTPMQRYHPFTPKSMSQNQQQQQLQLSTTATTATTAIITPPTPKKKPIKFGKINFTIDLTEPEPTVDNMVPGELDICIGRGRGVDNHKGNIYYRVVVELFRKQYEAISHKGGKSKFIRLVVAYIFDNGHQFVKKDRNGSWVPVDRDVARDKVSNSFRNAKRLQLLTTATPTTTPIIKKNRLRTVDDYNNKDDDDNNNVNAFMHDDYSNVDVGNNKDNDNNNSAFTSVLSSKDDTVNAFMHDDCILSMKSKFQSMSMDTIDDCNNIDNDYNNNAFNSVLSSKNATFNAIMHNDCSTVDNDNNATSVLSFKSKLGSKSTYIVDDDNNNNKEDNNAFNSVLSSNEDTVNAIMHDDCTTVDDDNNADSVLSFKSKSKPTNINNEKYVSKYRPNNEFIAPARSESALFCVDSKSNKDDMIRVPGLFDICIGRGRGTDNHQGNIFYRSVVESLRKDYEAILLRKDKTQFIREVVAFLYDNSCQFIKRDPSGSGTWVRVDPEYVRDKVSHSFRNARRLQTDSTTKL